MYVSDPLVFTPYSTISLLDPGRSGSLEMWVPEEDRDRIYAYQKYEELYWSHKTALKLAERGDEDDVPIYVPAPMTIVDTTSHFFMKGLKIFTENENSPTGQALKEFMEREMFLSTFHVAKQAGVTRGDFLLHLVANPLKPPGKRVSVKSIDPSVYFPTYEDEDPEKLKSVRLADTFFDADDPTKSLMRVQEYKYTEVDGQRRVTSQEAIFELREWWSGKQRVKFRSVRPEKLLPARIDVIPVYHWKNKEWQGWDFGASELKGFETIVQAIDQGATDEGMALALEGLGVYATNSGPPQDPDGNPTNWIIAPAQVMELDDPQASFRRVEGVSSVKPFQDHFAFLQDAMYEASATFRGGAIDAQVAESGVALAIKFLPTEAKLEQRDEAGVGKLKQFWFDWKNWWFAYEGQQLSDDIQVVLADKLPLNKNDRLNVLNNMVDRKAIPRKYYREQVAELYGLEMPADIEQQLLKEAQEAFEEAQKRAELGMEGGGATAPSARTARNGERPNESAGTEANQDTRRQQRPAANRA